MFKAEVICDSLSPQGHRLTTMIVTMPRYILAEFNTHRMFSRNSASSRAVRKEKMMQLIREKPFMPIAWQKDHPGMQGMEYFGERETFTSSNPHDKTAPGIDADPVTNLGPGGSRIIIEVLKERWLQARDFAVQSAELLADTGVHYYPDGNESKLTAKDRGLTKQLVNRLLEPFMWHTVLVTSHEWENFFALRCPQYTLDGTNVFRSKRDLKNAYQDASESNKAILGNHLLSGDMAWFKINRGMADIHMMKTAELMWDAFNESNPVQLQAGEWHIPFGDDDVPMDWEVKTEGHTIRGKLNPVLHDQDIIQRKVQVATARCARISYTLPGEEVKRNDYAKEIELHDRLAKSGHWSPFEHCARAMSDDEHSEYLTGDYGVDFNSKQVVSDGHGYLGNFRGFIQYRKMFANENLK